jgi:hypothetical protein
MMFSGYAPMKHTSDEPAALVELRLDRPTLRGCAGSVSLDRQLRMIAFEAFTTTFLRGLIGGQ